MKRTAGILPASRYRRLPAGTGLILVLTVLFLATTIEAHTVGVSRGSYQIHNDVVDAELAFARSELRDSLPSLDADHNGSITVPEIDAAHGTLEAAIIRKVVVDSAAGTCPGILQDAALTEQDGLLLRAQFRCSSHPGDVTFTVTFPALLTRGHRHLATLNGPTVTYAVAYGGNTQLQLSPRQAAARTTGVALPLFRMGILHILTGYDHLVFLMGLILAAGRLRPLLIAVTSFTLAHSMTLGLAALGMWTPAPKIVEPLIALSIAYVGIENCWIQDASRRWLITFPFGLIHGFGFAGALREIAVPQGQIPLALASFNLGVEAGQIAFLLLLLPALLWLRKRPWFSVHGVRAISAVLVVAGCWWFVSRITGA